MKIERAVEVLESARDHAERMEQMYREETIPAAQKELDRVIVECNEQQQKIAEIDRLLEMAATTHKV